MSHCIQPDDYIKSVGDTWHGLDIPGEHKERGLIIREDMGSALFPIIEGSPSITMEDGTTILIEGQKGLVADFRHREQEFQDRSLPFSPYKFLAAPGKDYHVFENSDVFKAAEDAIGESGAKIVTCGTLSGCKVFFLTIDIGNTQLIASNGDKFESYLNLITSHDGTLALQAYDSSTRIVCMNTLKYSLNTAGDLGFTFKHTKGNAGKFENFGRFANAILENRNTFMEAYNGLLTIPMSELECKYLVSGFLAGESEKLSTNAYNKANSIADFFRLGKGNKGESMADVLNGFTEFYTSGDGTGKTASIAEKVSSANFGNASEWKAEFFDLLINQTEREKMIEKGKFLYNKRVQGE
jgi:Domain of unknown function (DUF932)